MKGRAIGLVLVAALLAIAIFTAGRWTARTAPVKHGGEDGRAAVSADSRRPSGVRARTGSRLTALLAMSASDCPSTDPDTLRQARLDRATFLLDQVFQELRAHALGGVDQVEDRARYALPYLRGVLNGALQADSGLRQAFSSRFTTGLCDGNLEADQTVTLANMALILPDAATSQGFDCFFSRAKKEDLPVWTMLDAWRHSGLEKTPAIARLQATATDPRTTRRFLSDAEAALNRAGQHYSNVVPANERTETP